MTVPGRTIERFGPRLAATLLISASLHLLMLPMLAALMHEPPAMTTRHARFHPETFLADDLQRPRLGIRRDDAPQTLTWVGYEEYQEHLARPSDIDQAAMMTAAPPPGSTPAIPGVTAPMSDVVAAAAPTPAPQVLPVDPIIPPMLEHGRVPMPATAARAVRPEAIPTPQPEPPSPPAPPGPTVAPTPVPDPEADIAEVSDRESQAFSVEVSLNTIKHGRPVAARGLELKPRRPNFSMLVLLTASPGNVLVEMRFGRKGKPVEASILEGSDDSRVDSTILSSLYRWRATGDDLDALEDDETIDVRINIVLRR